MQATRTRNSQIHCCSMLHGTTYELSPRDHRLRCFPLLAAMERHTSAVRRERSNKVRRYNYSGRPRVRRLSPWVRLDHSQPTARSGWRVWLGEKCGKRPVQGFDLQALIGQIIAQRQRSPSSSRGVTRLDVSHEAWSNSRQGGQCRGGSMTTSRSRWTRGTSSSSALLSRHRRSLHLNAKSPDALIVADRFPLKARPIQLKAR